MHIIGQKTFLKIYEFKRYTRARV